MSSQRYPQLAPLQINKRAGQGSPVRSRNRDNSTASITSNSSLSPDGSLKSSSTYPDSASAARVASVFIAEVDEWILDIRQQLDELEEKHAKHREWLASGGAEDIPETEALAVAPARTSEDSELSEAEDTGSAKESSEGGNGYFSSPSSSLFSFFSKSSRSGSESSAASPGGKSANRGANASGA